MLIRYKKAFEKIAMGLLSFMPEHKDVKRLMDTIQEYEQNNDWYLYLWKKEEEHVGAIGFKLDGNTAVIQHITVIPSYRGEGIGTEMVTELTELDQFENVTFVDETQAFIQKCLKDLKEADAL